MQRTRTHSSRPLGYPNTSEGLRRLWIAALAVLIPLSASAQQESQDREEFDRVAGRAVFRNVPIADQKPFGPKTTARGNLAASNQPNVRVILASPYGR